MEEIVLDTISTTLSKIETFMNEDASGEDRKKTVVAYSTGIEKEKKRLLKLTKDLKKKKQMDRKRILQNERKRQKVINSLRSMGNCPAGFNWVRKGDYFRCEGGSHTVKISDLLIQLNDKNITESDINELLSTL